MPGVDLSEKFENLSKPPIVESVIEFRTLATTSWDQPATTAMAKELAPELLVVQALHLYKTNLSIDPTRVRVADQSTEDLGWNGLRMEPQDRSCVVQFLRDKFVFSKLGAYTNGEELVRMAMHYWEIHKRLAAPEEITRVGLRYVNRIVVPVPQIRLEEYLTSGLGAPAGFETFGLNEFFHQETYLLPETDYRVKILQTVESDGNTFVGLLIDTDTFILKSLPPDTTVLTEVLSEMRWLKNKAFFGSITDKCKKLLI